jgi:hypothetical protein
MTHALRSGVFLEKVFEFWGHNEEGGEKAVA